MTVHLRKARRNDPFRSRRHRPPQAAAEDL